ncbi:hypothetical protein HF086_015387 [Spodoptera exigua]|uniref:G-protein coupled receptors family 2 profile 2 domain-containing protein n=1 Tax=Spodoptera exigua TaxID=7107 RepID=A0A922M0W2_SPOEX|nr:hypothetical protein HF086_015387 [Spodoptera exigua]
MWLFTRFVIVALIIRTHSFHTINPYWESVLKDYSDDNYYYEDYYDNGDSDVPDFEKENVNLSVSTPNNFNNTFHNSTSVNITEPYMNENSETENINNKANNTQDNDAVFLVSYTELQTNNTHLRVNNTGFLNNNTGFLVNNYKQQNNNGDSQVNIPGLQNGNRDSRVNSTELQNNITDSLLNSSRLQNSNTVSQVNYTELQNDNRNPRVNNTGLQNNNAHSLANSSGLQNGYAHSLVNYTELQNDNRDSRVNNTGLQNNNAHSLSNSSGLQNGTAVSRVNYTGIQNDSRDSRVNNTGLQNNNAHSLANSSGLQNGNTVSRVNYTGIQNDSRDSRVNNTGLQNNNAHSLANSSGLQNVKVRRLCPNGTVCASKCCEFGEQFDLAYKTCRRADHNQNKEFVPPVMITLDEADVKKINFSPGHKLSCLKSLDEEKRLVTEITKVFRLRSVSYLVTCFFVILRLSLIAWLPELRTLHGVIIIAYLANFIVGYFLTAIKKLFMSEHSISRDLCVALNFMIYFWILSAFFWRNVIGKRVLTRGNTIPRLRFGAYFAYAFGVPAVLTIILAAMEYSKISKLHPLKPKLRLNGCDGISVDVSNSIILLMLMIQYFCQKSTWKKVKKKYRQMRGLPQSEQNTVTSSNRTMSISSVEGQQAYCNSVASNYEMHPK